MGKLIVIEGLDGCGKSTQLELLPQNLLKNGIESKSVSFPDYDSNSSALVKMYLGGEFGKKPSDVNAYAASLFYAVDRFASYKTNWGDYYNQNGVIVSGRYTTSNAVHQTSKMDESEWQGFLDWLYDLEYNKVGIPKPDKVIFLDMPIEVSQKLLSGMATRVKKIFTKVIRHTLINVAKPPCLQQNIRVGQLFLVQKTANHAP